MSLMQLLLFTGCETSLTTLTTVSCLVETYFVTPEYISESAESSRAISMINALIKEELEETEAGLTPPPGAVVLSESVEHDTSPAHDRIVYGVTAKKSSNKQMKWKGGVFVDTPLRKQGRILDEIDTHPPLPRKAKGREKRVAKEGCYIEQFVAWSKTEYGKKRKEGLKSSEWPVAPEGGEKRKGHCLELRVIESHTRTSINGGTFGQEPTVSALSSTSSIQQRDSLLGRATTSLYRGQVGNEMSPGHSRNWSHIPTVYTIHMFHSQTALLFEFSTTLTFPSGDQIRHLSNYMQFVSHSYGKRLLLLYAVKDSPTAFPATTSHHATH
ncbi:hypothetical protein HOY80DRAFT_1046088 [Tuber brumale]|nr:hypothetical protein HOY80DRAFT_1046088 [Tuber brumale]